ncbi:Peptidyl-tRNA hydrolase [Roseimaritima multifibrata]|uniref:Peptidyl-tRNA hydrolase n=1 Tax=Roseimaritima multifibrata TaxID=1930274 RepID=A0A517MCR0_9BACT|nr:aminoacyl-tRNA hydrolase [Roseimaritima multifibrata]QDS92678.1 Peptidyl-tRNA hydrolase [Roseimaritima multifibrata]
MKLVVGLGNPGRRYDQTRHNVGFAMAAEFAKMIGGDSPRGRFDGDWIEGSVEGTKVGLLCPLKYMNASGLSVRQATDFYKLSAADVLVVCDDMNLPLGRLRIRAGGSAGGQKGLADVIRHLATDRVPRLRVGIDPPPSGWNVPDYVLSKFKSSEQATVDQAVQRAAFAAADWVQHDLAFCMNRYNGKDESD